MGAEKRLALLVSGGGTTMKRILEECTPRGDLSEVHPVLVVSSVSGAGAIAKAQQHLPTNDVVVLDPADFGPPGDGRDEGFGAAIIMACRARGVSWIGQYGWMPKTPANVIRAYGGRMINQHPGPLRPGLPDFGGQGMYGRRVHAARLYFVRRTKRAFWTEVVAQHVAEEFDLGSVIDVERIPIEPDDTVESLQQRSLPVEHEVQIRTLARFMHGDAQMPPALEPLVLPGEEAMLEEAKRTARLLYPKG